LRLTFNRAQTRQLATTERRSTKITIRGYRAVLTGLSANPIALVQSERPCEGMRKAGYRGKAERELCIATVLTADFRQLGIKA